MADEYRKVFKGKFCSYDRYPQGDNDKLLAALGYPIPIVALIALFAIKPLSPFLRFHSIQALGLGIVIWILWFIGIVLSFAFIGFCLFPIAGLLWIYTLVIAVLILTGKDHRVPLGLADYIESNYV